MRWMSLCLSAVLFVPMLGTPARGDTFTSGNLELNLENTGQFDQIYVGNDYVDPGGPVQTQYVNGQRFFTDGSPIVIDGRTATYSAMSPDGKFSIGVISRELGTLAGAAVPENACVFEQVFTFTNVSDAPSRLTSVSLMEPDLGNHADLGHPFYLPDRQLVFGRLFGEVIMAALPYTDAPGATLGWDVGFDYVGDTSVDFPMTGRTQHPPDMGSGVAMSIGYDFGTVDAGETRTLANRYFFQTFYADPEPPADFTIPEPAGLPLLSLLAFLGRRPRRANSHVAVS